LCSQQNGHPGLCDFSRHPDPRPECQDPDCWDMRLPGDHTGCVPAAPGEAASGVQNSAPSPACCPTPEASPRAPGCASHPQAGVWPSESGARCAICGVLLSGAANVVQPVQVRNLDTFQTLTQRTSVVWKEGLVLSPMQAHLLQAALGIAGEGGEFVDHVKKHVFHGHPLDIAKLREECGDVLWYAADAASAIDAKLADVATENEAKLQRRYPNGFSRAASITRVDKGEPFASVAEALASLPLPRAHRKANGDE